MGTEPNQPPGPTDKVALTALTENQRALAHYRFKLLQPHLEQHVPLTRIAVGDGPTLRTLRTWVKRYQKHGLAGLVALQRGDRGRFRLPDELRKLIEGLALQKPRPSSSSVYRRVRTIAASKGWPVPSYRAVARMIKKLPPSLVILAHEGTKAYGQAFDLLYRREASRPNEIWQADHTPMDIWVFDEQDEPARPWLTVIIDDYSRAVAGWRVSFLAPSALQTALTLRQAIWRKDDARWTVFGIPDILYTDHGSDFISRHLEQVASDLHFEPIFSTVGEPRGRGRIERFFGTVNELFLQDQPGYTPPKKPPAKPVLTLPQLESRLSEFLLSDYHRRDHSETGCPPQARWESGGFLPRTAESLEKLDLLLLTLATSRRIRRDGIYFQTLRYLDPLLAAYVGETVTIRYDPRDVTEIRVFLQDQFLCRAISQELSGQVVALKDIIRARRTQRRELRTRLKNHRAVVDALLEAHRPETATQRPPPLPKPPSPQVSAKPRLKRYMDDDLNDD